ncbi:MAG: hypothetical protein FWE06_03340 [Oscillospiraceae bacterium]|nr:hypothetical protein [Oscillospiraceae bacterium]
MKQKITILYERLSKDDELQGTSNSILNQRQLLEEYAERNGLTPYIPISKTMGTQARTGTDQAGRS